ncbi:hypothetical protein [Poseidonibacter ostreae]|uniref:Uncharacterized protein n=1 Tax=Poseidonibacter ostreae TaxID=2654171 RepID=A0A6L4WTU9_9BACT|nr:hypothetical protein [Poseidonibacter ostreae]KAB7889581.1 hypothetical protein GBG19_05860 [Poseidonibacter ostreae]
MIINNKEFLYNVKKMIIKIETEKVSLSLTLMKSIFVYIRDTKHLTESMLAYLAQYFVSSKDMSNNIYKYLEKNYQIKIVKQLCGNQRVVSVNNEVCDV